MAGILGTWKGALAAAMVLLVLLAAVLGPLAAPHDPAEQHLELRLQGSSHRYPLGTDELGRCTLSRLLWGARMTVLTALLVVAVAAVIGAVLGAAAGYLGGMADGLIMRAVDVVLSLPGLVLAIVVAGALGPSLVGVMLALTLVHWTAYARLMRGCVLSVKQEPYVEAARAIGAGPARILLRHVLPGCIAPMTVMVTFGLGHMVLAAAALSFLGLGAQPPTAEWGAMLSRGREFMRNAPQLMAWPGLAIMASVFGFNLLGDALRDALTRMQEGKGPWTLP